MNIHTVNQWCGPVRPIRPKSMLGTLRGEGALPPNSKLKLYVA